MTTAQYDGVMVALTVLSSIVGLAVVVAQERPASTIALGAGGVIVLAAGSLRAWRRSRRGWPFRVMVIGGWCVLLVAFAVAAVHPSSKRVVIHDVLGLEDTAVDVRFTAMQVLDAPGRYKLVAFVENQTKREQLVDHVRLILRLHSGDDCLDGSRYYYLVAGDVRVAATLAKRPRGFTGKVHEKRDGVFYAAATGQLEDSCADHRIDLGFASGVRLPPNEQSEISIELPERLSVYPRNPGKAEYVELSRFLRSGASSSRRRDERRLAGLEVTIQGRVRVARCLDPSRDQPRLQTCAALD